jgi:putative isomerase
VRLGRHHLDGSLVELELNHAGTQLAWHYEKPDPLSFAGSWRTVRTGEWGLRFWINLCLSTDLGETVRFDAARNAAVVRIGQSFVALVSSEAPVQVTGHQDLAGALADYEAHGYFYKGSRSNAAPVLVLRFNLEMMRENRFGVAVAGSEDVAIERASAVMSPREAIAAEAQAGSAAVALGALRDAIAWNTVWDGINQRAYTSISRNWDLGKFGGFGVWLNDQFYAALMAGDLDANLGHENFAVALSNATPEGNLACLITANDAWVDRSQSPIGSFVAWMLYLRSGSREFLEAAYPVLARNHAWWWRERDPEASGLASFGSSNTGDGLYKGTAFGARNESAMDNSPIHDEARWNPETRTLDCWDVGLNSLLALDAEMLGLIAAELGCDSEARTFATRAVATRSRISEHLWDAERGIFANRLHAGAFVRSLAPTSFYPLLADAATAEQAKSLFAHLDDPATFGGDPVIPGVSRDDPAFHDNSYWRGRIWPPFNYLVYLGLKRSGAEARASELARRSFTLFRRAWEKDRICPENYNAETGEPLDQPDTERFYSWGALMAKLGVAAITDITPWNGWEVINDGEPASLGPFASPLGETRLAIDDDGHLNLALGEATLLVTDIGGKICHLRFTAEMISLRLPSIPRKRFLRFPGVPASSIIEVSLNGKPAKAEGEGLGCLVELARCPVPQEFVLRRRL